MNSGGNKRLLRPGVNFTTRGELKYARAAHIANELRGRIDEWIAAETILARLHQSEERVIQFRLVLKSAPPIEEWSLILGDSLHNLRSAFDNVVWALATLDGATPRQPRQVAFPLTNDEQDWAQRAKTLESIPAELLARLRAIQPWASGTAREDSLLGVLHRLDIADKHQGLIASALHLKRLSVAGLDLGPKSQEEFDRAQIAYETRRTPVPFEEDAVLATIRSDSVSLWADPDYRARVDAQFAIRYDTDRALMLDSFLGDLLSRTREWLDLIYGGPTYANAMKASREATGPTVSFGYTDEQGVSHLVSLPMVEPASV